MLIAGYGAEFVGTICTTDCRTCLDQRSARKATPAVRYDCLFIDAVALRVRRVLRKSRAKGSNRGLLPFKLL
jgi:hypothetical protein